MAKQHKSFLFFAMVILLFSLSAGFSYALEVDPAYYPPIPFAPVVTADSELPTFVAYFFALGIYLAGALAVISLAIGGIQYIFSGISPDSKNDAKERIMGAILGLILTVSSVIILRTINPVLIDPALTPLDPGAGVFYAGGSKEKPAPYAESDTSRISNDYNKIIYRCSAGPVLIIQKFPEKNFGGYREVSTERIDCGGETSIDSASFKISFETPGIYYFLKGGCEGYMSQVSLSDTQEIEEPFKSEAQSVLIINDTKNDNDPKNDINYGVILHKEINFRGDCSPPLQSNKKERECHNFSSSGSANIFMLNNNSLEDAKTSGNGVVFYSKSFGFKTGTNAGYKKLSPEDIGIFWQDAPDKIIFDYTGVKVPDEEKELRKTFKDSPGSIEVKGNYLSVLYANQPQSKSLYCQVFNKDVPNLKEEEVTAVQGRQLEKIYVIPIK